MKFILVLIANIICLGQCDLEVGSRIISPGIYLPELAREPNREAGQSYNGKFGANVNLGGGGKTSEETPLSKESDLDLIGEVKNVTKAEMSQDILRNEKLIEDMREEDVINNDSSSTLMKHTSYVRTFKESSEVTFSNSSHELLEACTRVTVSGSVSVGFWIFSSSVHINAEMTNKKTKVVDSHYTQKVFKENEVTFKNEITYRVMPYQKLRIESFVEIYKNIKLPYTALVRVTGTKRNGDRATAKDIKEEMRRRNSNGTVHMAGKDWVEYVIKGYIVATFGKRARTNVKDITDPISTASISTKATESTGTVTESSTIEGMTEKPGKEDNLIEPKPIGLGSMSGTHWIIVAIIVCIAIYCITKMIVRFKYRVRDEQNVYDIALKMSEGLNI